MSRKTRFWIETTLAALSAVLFLLTIIWKDWIEIVFGVEPDNGDGSAEWMIAVGTALVAIIFAVLARIEWRRLRAETA